MKNQGIYNPFTEKATRGMLDSYKTLTDESYDPLLQLRKVYSDDEIFNMLNTISRNEPTKNTMFDNIGYAKNGGLINKYAEGDNVGSGRWTETIVDPNTGERIPLINLKGVEIVGEKDYGSYIDQLRKDWANTYNEHPIIEYVSGTQSLLTLGNLLSTPQKSLMYGLTGRYDTPSNINPTRGLGNFQNSAVDLMQDIAFDPLNFVGAVPELFSLGKSGLNNIGKAGEFLTTQTL
jgi:hypothetical protein